MNKRLKNAKKTSKSSPVLFDDEEVGTSSSDEVKLTAKPATPRANSSYTGHSTPKIKTNTSDSPELNYNESPIEPLTQHPPNEVGWDYQRPLMKEDRVGSSSSSEITRTPKRNAAFLAKKRNSNSPLLHKPLKKKLIQEEQRECLAGFMEELKAIEMKAKSLGEKNVEGQKSEKDEESQLVIEIDSEPSGDSDIKLNVSADESPVQKRIEIVNKNSNEFLDDSMEDMLVMCSQQVEAEEFGTKNSPSNAQCSTSTWKVKKSEASHTIHDSKLSNNVPKKIGEPLNNNTKVNESSDKKSSSGREDSTSLEIPDDSFDDFMVDFDDKDFCPNSKTEVIARSENKICKNSIHIGTNSKISVAQNKFFQHKNSVCVKQTKIVTSKSGYNLSETSNASIQNKIMNTNASFGYLNQNYVKSYNSSGFISQTQTSNNSDKNNETRLFKSKSYSDSNFSHQCTAFNDLGKGYSIMESMNPQKTANKNPVRNVGLSHMNSENMGWRRVQSSSALNVPNVCNNRIQISSGKMSNSEGSLPLSTPAEIERKRQLAIMKREERLKSKLISTASQKRPIQNPIKR